MASFPIEGRWNSVYYTQRGSSTGRKLERGDFGTSVEVAKGKADLFNYTVFSSGSPTPTNSTKARWSIDAGQPVLELLSEQALTKKKVWRGKWKILQSLHGVNILQFDSSFLIRFESTPLVSRASANEENFRRFCSVTVKPLSKRIFTAIREVESRKKKPNLVFKYDTKREAGMLGLFFEPEFESVFGKRFINLSNSEKLQIIERLRACALFSSSSQNSRALLIALFGSDINARDLLVNAGLHVSGRSKLLRPSASDVSNSAEKLRVLALKQKS